MSKPHGPPVLPYGRQLIEDDDVAAVAAVLRGDWLTTGPAVDAFERAFAARVGAPYAVACSSGTAALHLPMLALGLGQGDVAIVPALTFVATANAVRYVGAEVVFADVEPETGLMGPTHFAEAVARARLAFPTHRVRAALPVHLNGQACDMAGLARTAEAESIALVEDACHALGADAGAASEDRVGACRHSVMAAFSGHPVKTIAMGEGGVVTTRDEALARRLARLRAHGINREPALFTERDQAFDAAGQPNAWYHELVELGFNYRASDLHCALGLSQLRKLDRFIAARAGLVERYRARLAALGPPVRPIDLAGHGTPAWHLFVVRIDFEAAGVSRNTVMARLKAKGIGTQVHYLPVNRQPYYRSRYGATALPGADAYYERALSLPLHAGMTEADVDRVVDALAAVLGRHGAVP